MRGVHPEDWLKVIRKQPADHTQHEMLKVLENPKIRELVDHPNPKIEKAIPAFRELSHVDAALKIKHEVLDPNAAELRPTYHQRIAAQELGREARGTGHAPAYVPDVAHPRDLANAEMNPRGGGIGQPTLTGSMRQNKGTLFRTGQLMLHPDVLGTEYLRTIKYGLFDDIHNELMSSAVRLEKGQHLPEGWEYIRRPSSPRPGTGGPSGSIRWSAQRGNERARLEN